MEIEIKDIFFMKIKKFFILKLLFTVLCLAIIFSNIKFSEFISLFFEISFSTISLSVLILLFHFYFVTQRWFFFIKEYKNDISFFNSLNLVILASFINQVFLGSIAGDTSRILMLKLNNFSIKKSISTVILDKFSALFGTWVLLSLCTFYFYFYEDFNNKYLNLISLTGFTMLLLPIMTKLVKKQFFKSQNILSKIMEFLIVMSYSFNSSFKNLKNIYLVHGTTFLIVLSSSVITWLISIDIQTNLNFMSCILITSLGLILSAIPVSVAGWGIRELTYISFLSYFSVQEEKSLIISVTFGFLVLFTSLLAYLIFLFSNKNFQKI